MYWFDRVIRSNQGWHAVARQRVTDKESSMLYDKKIMLCGVLIIISGTVMGMDNRLSQPNDIKSFDRDATDGIARIENSVIIYAQAMEKRKVIRDAKPCRQPHECLSRMLIYKNFMQEDRNLGTKIGTVAMIYKAFLEQVNGHTSCQISAGGMQDVHKEMVACRDEIDKHVRLCATIVKRFPQITEKIAKKIQSYHAAHEALVTSFECMHVFTSEMNKLGATVYEPAGDDQEPDQA